MQPPHSAKASSAKAVRIGLALVKRATMLIRMRTLSRICKTSLQGQPGRPRLEQRTANKPDKPGARGSRPMRRDGRLGPPVSSRTRRLTQTPDGEGRIRVAEDTGTDHKPVHASFRRFSYIIQCNAAVDLDGEAKLQPGAQFFQPADLRSEERRVGKE